MHKNAKKTHKISNGGKLDKQHLIYFTPILFILRSHFYYLVL